MKPSIGRIVIIFGISASSNGADRAPAIITRVWGQAGADTQDGPVLINTMCFADCALPQAVTSVRLYETEAAAIASGDDNAACWPERA